MAKFRRKLCWLNLGTLSCVTAPLTAAFVRPLDYVQNHSIYKSFLIVLIGALAGTIAWAQSEDMQAIRGFSIDRYEVSIAQFARYVQVTGIVTSAEKAGGGSTYEGGWVERKGWTWRTSYGFTANDIEHTIPIATQCCAEILKL